MRIGSGNRRKKHPPEGRELYEDPGRRRCLPGGNHCGRDSGKIWDPGNPAVRYEPCTAVSEIKIIGAGADAVDFALVGICEKGDLVVTQDYGVAAMILGKGAYGIHQSGKWYTNENIDQMLIERHLSKKARRSKSKHHIKGPAKRTAEDDRRFRESLEQLIRKIKSE